MKSEVTPATEPHAFDSVALKSRQNSIYTTVQIKVANQPRTNPKSRVAEPEWRMGLGPQFVLRGFKSCFNRFKQHN